MNKHVKISLIVVVTIVLLLALTIPVLAKSELRYFHLKFNMDQIDEEYYTAWGTFSSEGAILDEGEAYGHWNPYWGHFLGTSIFESSTEGKGRIVVRWSSGLTDEIGCAYGNFQFYPYQSTGEYYGILGAGKITICFDNEGNIIGSLDGVVVYP